MSLMLMVTAGKREIFAHSDGAPLPAVHPGETLADELAAQGGRANALALKLRVPAKRLTDICAGAAVGDGGDGVEAGAVVWGERAVLDEFAGEL